MRQHKATAGDSAFSILALDDDPIMTSTVQSYFQRSGYRVDVENDPLRAIERIREGHYDILLLDFLMTPICGDQVVEEIRKFNRELFIILLTGHKDMAPPIRTIRALDIQGYYEKSDRFDQLELLVESCVKSIRQLRTIRCYQEGLTCIMEALPNLYHLQSVEYICDGILRTVTRILNCSGCILILDTTQCGMADAEAGPHHYLSRAVGSRISVPEGKQVELLLETLAREGHLTEQNQVSFPMTNGSQVVGLLCAEWEKKPEYDQIQLLEVFSKQASAALSNTLLHALVQKKSDQLEQAYRRLGDSYEEIIITVRSIVDAKDLYTRNHSDRVSFYASELAKYLGHDEAYCDRLRLAGLFHDIGKLGIPDEILQKSGRLTDEEFSLIKTHPIRGAELLAYISYFHDIIPWIRSHHERYDGKGYPDGLAGTEIPEQSRIISVADAFDAMTSNRHYRNSLGPEKALLELKKEAGSQFDPVFAEAFVELAQEPGFMERAAQADGRGNTPPEKQTEE